jgi:proteasome lid subunit RPN8/RPN11
MKAGMVVSINEDLLQAILEGARTLYPKETILLLRGKKTGNAIIVSDLVVPPLATYGHGFARIPTHMLPIDFSIIGTLHSHPSGNVMPSSADLNHFFGKVLMIVGYPYENEKDAAAYNCGGERLPLQVTKPKP